MCACYWHCHDPRSRSPNSMNALRAAPNKKIKKKSSHWHCHDPRLGSPNSRNALRAVPNRILKNQCPSLPPSRSLALSLPPLLLPHIAPPPPPNSRSPPSTFTPSSHCRKNLFENLCRSTAASLQLESPETVTQNHRAVTQNHRLTSLQRQPSLLRREEGARRLRGA
jgi:hypothetical protein